MYCESILNNHHRNQRHIYCSRQWELWLYNLHIHLEEVVGDLFLPRELHSAGGISWSKLVATGEIWKFTGILICRWQQGQGNTDPLESNSFTSIVQKLCPQERGGFSHCQNLYYKESILSNLCTFSILRVWVWHNFVVFRGKEEGGEAARFKIIFLRLVKHVCKQL